MALEVRALGREERGAFREAIAALERGTRYPLGDDAFELDHGPDYFAFFDRLGELTYLVALSDGELVGVAAAVLRRVPQAGGPPAEAWYLADLKLRPGRRGLGLAARLLAWGVPRLGRRCPRGYGISMDPARGPNRVAKLLTRLPDSPLRPATGLHLYSLDAAAMARVEPRLREARGPLGYLSLVGKKDLILASSGRPLPLLHVQFGPCAEVALERPRADHAHMFCLPSGDPLIASLEGLGLGPTARATVLAAGMDGGDWRFVLTSDI